MVFDSFHFHFVFIFFFNQIILMKQTKKNNTNYRTITGLQFCINFSLAHFSHSFYPNENYHRIAKKKKKSHKVA